MALLTITSGPDKGREFPLGDSQVIGRLARCTIPIRDSRASREHARIFRGADGFYVVDLNSKNGVIVSGEKVQRQRLDSGVEFLIGDTWCRIDYTVEEIAPAAAGSAPAPVPAGAPAASADVRVRKDGSGRISTEPVRSATTQRRSRTTGGLTSTRTSLAWLRTDLSQVGGLYRALIAVGLMAVAVGLGYLAWRWTS